MYKLGLKRQRNQKSNCQHSLDHSESKQIPEKVSTSKPLCGSQQIRENSEIGILDHLTCLLRHLWAGQKQQLEPYMEQLTGSNLRKNFIKAVYCHPAYLTPMQGTSCKVLDWLAHKLESRLLGEISATSDMQIITL